MKKIGLLMICFLSTFLSHSQSYFSANSVVPNQVYTGFEAQQSIFFKLYNSLGIKTNYNWVRSDVCALPIGWNAFVCDCDNCYTVYYYSNALPGYVIDSCTMYLSYQFDFGADQGIHTTKMTFTNPADTSMQAVSLYLTINNGCSPAGLYSSNKKPIRIYPIPSYDNITIEGLLENDISSIYIYNSIGQLLFEEKNINASNLKIDISHFANGIYFLNLKNKEGSFVNTYKIEKR